MADTDAPARERTSDVDVEDYLESRRRRTRHAVDLLLRHYPAATVQRVHDQPDGLVGNWVEVDLCCPGGDVLRFAIWKNTGHVFRADAFGAMMGTNPVILNDYH